MTWLSEVPAGTTLHAIDITKSKATAACGGDTGVCVDHEDANCPACKTILVARMVGASL